MVVFTKEKNEKKNATSRPTLEETREKERQAREAKTFQDRGAGRSEQSM